MYLMISGRTPGRDVGHSAQLLPASARWGGGGGSYYCSYASPKDDIRVMVRDRKKPEKCVCAEGTLDLGSANQILLYLLGVSGDSGYLCSQPGLQEPVPLIKGTFPRDPARDTVTRERGVDFSAVESGPTEVPAPERAPVRVGLGNPSAPEETLEQQVLLSCWSPFTATSGKRCALFKTGEVGAPLAALGS